MIIDTIIYFIFMILIGYIIIRIFWLISYKQKELELKRKVMEAEDQYEETKNRGFKRIRK